jgi:hypothetical protein
MKKNLILYAIGGFAIYWLLFRKPMSQGVSVQPQTEVPLDETSSAPTPPTRGGVVEAQVIDLPSGTTTPNGYVTSNVISNNQGTPIIPQRPKSKLFGLQVPRLAIGKQLMKNDFETFRKPKIVNYTNLQRITPYDDASRIVRYKDKTFGDIIISEIDQNQDMVWYFEANRYPITILYPKR